MISRAAGNDINLVEGIEIVCIPFELIHDDGLAILSNALAHRVADSLRLLVDFLEHEVLIAALLSSFGIPVDFENLLRHRLAVAIRDLDSILRNDSKLTIVEDVRAARVRNDSWNIGSDEVLTFADTDDEWVILFRADASCT